MEPEALDAALHSFGETVIYRFGEPAVEVAAGAYIRPRFSST